jgi:deoxyribodipyrimidine photo-lyase
MEKLRTDFQDRRDLQCYIASIAPWLEKCEPSAFAGGAQAAESQMHAVNPTHYARTRNFLDGSVTRLSPYIRHGIITLAHVRDKVLAEAEEPRACEKLIQELAWRDYWQRIYRCHPERVWHDVEPYKTGYLASDYVDELPQDVATGTTGVACIDQFINELLETGYLHNHARMYVAAYVVHWRRVRWQAGARWFLHYLLDGDPASNNFSWQWVASTFSAKPYIFNLENVRKYATDEINTAPSDNYVLDHSYDELAALLFPLTQAQG